jgi:hypothetical protein
MVEKQRCFHVRGCREINRWMVGAGKNGAVRQEGALADASVLVP